MPKEREIVNVLDALTIGGLEAAPTEKVKSAQRLRKILGSKNIVGIGVAEKVTAGKPTGIDLREHKVTLPLIAAMAAMSLPERRKVEALFAAGDRFNEVLDAVAGAIEADERIKTVLESPRVSKAAKGKILERALQGEAPVEFVRFLQAVVRRGRQGLLPEIARQVGDIARR